MWRKQILKAIYISATLTQNPHVRALLSGLEAPSVSVEKAGLGKRHTELTELAWSTQAELSELSLELIMSEDMAIPTALCCVYS